MGLFDRMIKSGVGKVIGDTVSNAVSNALNNGESNSAPAQASAPAPKFCPSCGAALKSGMRFCGSCGASIGNAAATPAANDAPRDRAYFAKILSEDFASYEKREFVSPAELGGSGKEYDFALYRGGKLAGVVMLTEHNRDNNAAFRNAKQACQAAGVPFINFYMHMPNERDYIVSRIKGML